MIPHYVVHHQQCEFCKDTIFIGYECIKHEDGYYCTKDCLKAHLYLMSNAKEVYLTDDNMYREVD